MDKRAKLDLEKNGNEPIEDTGIKTETITLSDGTDLTLELRDSGLVPFCTECGIENGPVNTIVLKHPDEYYPSDILISCKHCGGLMGEFDPSDEENEEEYDEEEDHYEYPDTYNSCRKCGSDDVNRCGCYE